MSFLDRNIRDRFLTERITGYLERKAPPRNLSPKAQADEMAALIRCFMRFAPKEGFEDWWPRFEDRLDEDAKTRAWPNAGEIKSAAMAVRGPSSKRISEGDEINPLEVYGKRMEAGEAVPQGCLYGRMALDLLGGGHVTQDLLRKYRSAWYFMLKGQYGEEYARQKEAEAIALHESVERDDQQPARKRAPEPQPNKVKTYEWDGAQ